MLDGMHTCLNDHYNDRYESWDKLVEFIATDHAPWLLYEIKGGLDWLFKDSELARKLFSYYDPKLLHSDEHDHLGDMYIEDIVSKREAQKRGLFLTPDAVALLIAEITMPAGEKLYTILDPAVGTGRLLLAAHKRAPNALLFGVDTDLRSLRIAYANFAIHGIKGYLLHADSLRYEIDISKQSGKANWTLANNWYSQMEKMKPIEPKDSARGDQHELFTK